MVWLFTDDVAAYARHATELLAGDPARNTVALTVLEVVRAGRRWSPDPMLFGWSESGGHVSGAVCMTPPYELLLAAVELSDVVPLVDALLELDVTIPGVNGETSVATAFTAAWTPRRGVRSAISRHERLYRLDVLIPPRTVVGRPRVAVPADTAVAVDWFSRFQVEAGARPVDVGPAVDDRIDGGRLWLWEDADGWVVSMAGRAATAVGVARVGPVFTPVGQRRRGYGAAVTAACTADALTRGAHAVVLVHRPGQPDVQRHLPANRLPPPPRPPRGGLPAGLTEPVPGAAQRRPGDPRLDDGRECVARGSRAGPSAKSACDAQEGADGQVGAVGTGQGRGHDHGLAGG